MKAEFYALLANNTWSLVPPLYDMHVISNKWVFHTKYKPDVTVDSYKACLIARGFEEIVGVDYFETFNLVIKGCTVRLVFPLVVTY